jgi:anti-sigma-K factor RskA
MSEKNTNDHSKFRETIPDYLEGRLPENERRAFEERLSTDAELKRDVEEFSATLQLLRVSKIKRPSPIYFASNLARIRQRIDIHSKSMTSWKWRTTYSSVCTIGVLLLFFFLWSDRSENPTTLMATILNDMPQEERVTALVEQQREVAWMGVYQNDVSTALVPDHQVAALLQSKFNDVSMSNGGETYLVNSQTAYDEIDETAVDEVLNRMKQRSIL